MHYNANRVDNRFLFALVFVFIMWFSIGCSHVGSTTKRHSSELTKKITNILNHKTVLEAVSKQVAEVKLQADLPEQLIDTLFLMYDLGKGAKETRDIVKQPFLTDAVNIATLEKDLAELNKTLTLVQRRLLDPFADRSRMHQYKKELFFHTLLYMRKSVNGRGNQPFAELMEEINNLFKSGQPDQAAILERATAHFGESGKRFVDACVCSEASTPQRRMFFAAAHQLFGEWREMLDGIQDEAAQLAVVNYLLGKESDTVLSIEQCRVVLAAYKAAVALESRNYYREALELFGMQVAQQFEPLLGASRLQSELIFHASAYEAAKTLLSPHDEDVKILSVEECRRKYAKHYAESSKIGVGVSIGAAFGFNFVSEQALAVTHFSELSLAVMNRCIDVVESSGEDAVSKAYGQWLLLDKLYDRLVKARATLELRQIGDQSAL